MFHQRIIIVACLIFIGDLVQAYPKCDTSRKMFEKEGNNGQIADFPWLGVLRVHLHYEATFKVAITGIVLVKEGYAIANANDVARIPKRVFIEDSQAMFIQAAKQPWYCKLKDYMTHPEFEYTTLNTIALIELDPWEDRFYPIKPICWSRSSSQSMSDLYAVGFTDENMILEKSIYRIQSVRLSLCEEFYKRAGLSENKITPAHYKCGFAESNKNNCIWDNGMLLVSNSTGYWTLRGFGVHGPGCSAPARFIDLTIYFPWIESATDVRQIDDGRRRPKYIKMHNILAHKGIPGVPYGKQDYAHWYPFYGETEDISDFNITRINQSSIIVYKIDDTHKIHGFGMCNESKTQIFHDDFTVNVRSSQKDIIEGGTAVYKISLYDLNYMNYTCVTLSVAASEPETAYLSYRTKIEVMSAYPDTPDDLLRFYVLKDRIQNAKDGVKPGWKPNPVLRPDVIRDIRKDINITNINIYLTVKFRKDAKLHLVIYGRNYEITTTRRRRRTRSTTRPTTLITQDPYEIGKKRRKRLLHGLSTQSLEDTTTQFNYNTSMHLLRVQEEHHDVGNAASTLHGCWFICLMYAFL